MEFKLSFLIIKKKKKDNTKSRLFVQGNQTHFEQEAPKFSNPKVTLLGQIWSRYKTALKQASNQIGLHIPHAKKRGNFWDTKVVRKTKQDYLHDISVGKKYAAFCGCTENKHIFSERCK